jgi:hypothetical protein
MGGSVELCESELGFLWQKEEQQQSRAMITGWPAYLEDSHPYTPSSFPIFCLFQTKNYFNFIIVLSLIA